MKNTYAVFVFGNEYTCTNFFDTDKGSGVDISYAGGEHIGSIIGESVPELDADEDETTRFENVVETWLVDNED